MSFPQSSDGHVSKMASLASPQYLVKRYVVIVRDIYSTE